MKQGVFVTGTDTGIGKTTVCAALLHRYRPARIGYWKPVQTGAPEDDDTRDVSILGECAKPEIHPTGIRLPRPLSPHLSARLCGETIRLESILEEAERADPARSWIVEGAGGLLVPLNDADLIVDLIGRLGLPALIVARSQLGTINHTLLTIEALRHRRIAIAGAVMVGESNLENRRAIEDYGGVSVIGEMPRFPSLTAAVLRQWAQSELDRASHLAAVLGD